MANTISRGGTQVEDEKSFVRRMIEKITGWREKNKKKKQTYYGLGRQSMKNVKKNVKKRREALEQVGNP